jgi:Ca2+ transporting ATPase
MTARALYLAFTDYSVNDPSMTLGDYLKTFEGGANPDVLDILARAIAIDSMDETVLYVDGNGKIEGTNGNRNRGCALYFWFTI